MPDLDEEEASSADIDGLSLGCGAEATVRRFSRLGLVLWNEGEHVAAVRRDGRFAKRSGTLPGDLLRDLLLS